MSALQTLLNTFREDSISEREKGTYFEELICAYLQNEATYRDLYSKVWTYADWASAQGLDARDTGIDLVAQTQGIGEYHAIQCKFYAENYRIQKKDIDSFFTASGKKPFVHRVLVTTTNNWSEHAEHALQGQQPPVTKIDLHDLETSQIDWAKYQPHQAPILKPKKVLRGHQTNALNSVTRGFAHASKGKLIMACGTGKTFTSLKIAENLAGRGGRVLFLVPSLSLLSQTLTEWTQESAIPLHSFAVCSDSDVGNKRKKDDDVVQTFAHELRYPATTDSKRLALEMDKRHDVNHMSVVFSTYHSIDVISQAQLVHHLANFDLIICDEAHRTTGATFDDADESNFVKVHDEGFIRASKRLYMTATPRIYGEAAKVSAEKDNVALCSMDDEGLYGKELFVITFSEAVKRGLLVDYKVVVLAVDAKHVSERLQRLLSDEDNQLKVDDAAKIVGCWKALGKQGMQNDMVDDHGPMHRAVAFCQVIEYPTNAKTHKVSSKHIAAMFQTVVEAYQEKEQETAETPSPLVCEMAHVDGSMNASAKEEKLSWLKASADANTCRILSNVRCLSEGIDVPALDAVIFLTPRNSQVDVVQSVGRVMRIAPGKTRGYVILPVVIPAGIPPHEALSDNKTYKVVWQVLQALRSHDDRFDAMINKLDLIGQDSSKMEVVAITDKIAKKSDRPGKAKEKGSGKGTHDIGTARAKYTQDNLEKIQFDIGEIERAIYAKVVQKCGNRHHWEDWANDIAKIARTHITRITTIVENPANIAERAAFETFANELRDDLNDSLSDAEVIEMLAQHLITKPVFDALFSSYSFAKHNPMSRAMQGVLDVLQEHNLNKEADTLQAFYDSVKQRAEGIDNAAGKQKIIVELYDKFFANAFPRLKDKLGIVYTPVEVVDFIIHSVNDALQSEFGLTLGSKNVHIIDPFTGTGTFITRLLQSGLISKDQLAHKYQNEIHANEIVLLAYYIAAINIEAVYHSIIGGDYQPFNGICLTDTFQLHEKEDLVSDMLQVNSGRRKKQKELDIRVIIGNPPYSAGQASANDNNANVAYPKLDDSIRSTYAARSTATNKNALYDSYIRAIRWASDRLCKNQKLTKTEFDKSACAKKCTCNGVIGFVSNAGFIEANTADGLRKCLAEEFSSIYVFHLRGNQRTSGELSRREGGKIFGIGSRAPIAISILVKNPLAKAHGKIVLHDIGEYLSQKEKLEKITALRSIDGITAANGWQTITPDQHGDWLNQRDDRFGEFISLGDKKDKDAITMFENYSRGIATSRDAWCYHFSKATLSSNMQRMVSFYNAEVRRYQTACAGLSKDQYPDVDGFINTDSTKISWNRGLKNDLARHVKHVYQGAALTIGLYRPFTKSPVYFSKYMNDMVYQMPRIFPDSTVENRVIYLSGSGNSGTVFSALITNVLPDLNMQHSGGQGFPLKLYEAKQVNDAPTRGLFDVEVAQSVSQKYTVRDGITNAGLQHFQTAYPGESISKEDLFYYLYGLLHCEDYKQRYADNLSKELPRIPAVKKFADFKAFSTAGRKLAELHIDYENVQPYPVNIEGGTSQLTGFTDADYRVTQMKFASKADKTRVIYNPKITMTGIPLEAYDYVVNGKPALEWVMERQAVTTHKDSGIVNDANLWATETVGDAAYPLKLFQRVITVSLETMKIVKALPALDID